jgi:hypothetical protein
MTSISEKMHEIIVIPGAVKPDRVPQGVRFLNWEEARPLILKGDFFVRFKKYIGLKSSGRTPWAVIQKEGSHHVTLEYHSQLETAISSASRLREEQNYK